MVLSTFKENVLRTVSEFWALFGVEVLRIDYMNLWPHQVRALFGYDLGRVNTCSFFGWLITLQVTRVYGL